MSAQILLSGYPCVDEIMGGFRPGQLVVFGGAPGVGKTSLAANLALNMASEGIKIQYFTLEMSSRQIIQRFVAPMSLVPLDYIRKDNLSFQQRIACDNSARCLKELSIKIGDEPALAVDEIRDRAQQAMSGYSKAIVIVDYLQLIQPRYIECMMDIEDSLEAILQVLKSMALELGLPVVVLSQLSRKILYSGPRRPTLSDFRQADLIEQYADVIMLLDRSVADEDEVDGRPPKNRINIDVAVNKQGATGVAELGFDNSAMRIYSIADE